MFEPDSSHLFVHFPVLPVSLVSLVLKKNLTDCQTGSKGWYIKSTSPSSLSLTGCQWVSRGKWSSQHPHHPFKTHVSLRNLAGFQLYILLLFCCDRSPEALLISVDSTLIHPPRLCHHQVVDEKQNDILERKKSEVEHELKEKGKRHIQLLFYSTTTRNCKSHTHSSPRTRNKFDWTFRSETWLRIRGESGEKMCSRMFISLVMRPESLSSSCTSASFLQRKRWKIQTFFFVYLTVITLFFSFPSSLLASPSSSKNSLHFINTSSPMASSLAVSVSRAPSLLINSNVTSSSPAPSSSAVPPPAVQGVYSASGSSTPGPVTEIPSETLTNATGVPSEETGSSSTGEADGEESQEARLGI